MRDGNSGKSKNDIVSSIAKNSSMMCNN